MHVKVSALFVRVRQLHQQATFMFDNVVSLKGCHAGCSGLDNVCLVGMPVCHLMHLPCIGNLVSMPVLMLLWPFDKLPKLAY